MGRLAGKLALITGGNSGIGLACAKAFVAEGARVAITGRNSKTLDDARREIGDGNLAVACDVADLKQLDQLFGRIMEEFGALDIVFANAGILNSAPIDKVTEESYDEHFNINTKGAYFTVQKSLPLLRNGGSIILTSSVAIYTGTPVASVYAGTKGALHGFARAFAAGLAPRGIRANILTPGPIETPIWHGRGAMPNRDAMLKSLPLNRMGTVEDMTGAVVFLASDESRYMTGSEIVVDGGRSHASAGAPIYRVPS